MGRPIALSGLAAYLETISPFQQFLGIRVVKAEKGFIEIVLPFRSDFLGDRDPAYIHGGVVASLLDIAACSAVMAELERDVPTIDLRVDYLRPAGPGDLTAIGRVVRVGRTLGVADAEAFDADRRLVAVGRGLFSTRE